MMTLERPATEGALGEQDLPTLREHVVWLQEIADQAGPYRPRQVHRDELRAYADAARWMFNEVVRLREGGPG
jgi:hypothetical protein